MLPMQKTYSTNDFILYLYNETQLEDNVFIQQSIDNDDATAEDFSQLVGVQQLLDKVTFNPKKSSVDSIMAYSAMHGFLH